MRTFLLSTVLALSLGVGSGLYVLNRATKKLDAIRADLPQIDPPGTYHPPQKTRIVTADGTLLCELYRENRELLPLEQIPLDLANATIASEDRRFREHIGVSPRDIARAAVLNYRHHAVVQGASTITQQLARDLYLSRTQSVQRKIREALLAIEIEKRYAKDEILELYLNQINYGRGAYGARTAAAMYFGKQASELTLAECATLAAIPQRPADYNLYDDPGGAVRRRDVVLAEMTELGYVTADQRDRAKREKLVVQPFHVPSLQPRRAPYFTSWVVNEATRLLGEDRLYRGGLTITTTVDLKLQAAADKAVATMVQKARGRGATQGAAVVLDPKTGRVLAMVGGSNFAKSQFNCATQAQRQPGSAFKLFVYTAAIDRGYRPTDTIKDEPFEWKDPTGETWKPKNYDLRWHGEVTLLTALAQSINIPAIRLLQRVGPVSVAQYAERMGIRSPLRPFLSLALGTSEVNLLELTAAYGILPADGFRTDPTGIERVTAYGGKVLYDLRPQQLGVLTPRTVGTMIGMLQEVMRSGTGKAAALEIPCAGKTGTTQNLRDAWFVGFTPRLACGVWLGNDNDRGRMRGVYGGTNCGPAWKEILEAASEQGLEVKYDGTAWPLAPGMQAPYEIEIEGEEVMPAVKVCTDTGLLAGPYCPHTESRRYRPGAAPTETCPLHTVAPETGPSITPEGVPETTPGPEPEASPTAEPAALEPPPDDLTPAFARPDERPVTNQPEKHSPEPKPAGPLLNQYVVCRDSGLLAKPTCPHNEVREFTPGTPPTRVCDLH